MRGEQRRVAWRGWLLVATAALLGTAIGIGAFTFVYAEGGSYLTNDPAACSNCHIMDEHYSAWLKSSHRVAATCNDCHTPHDFVGKWTVKAKNGFWHSFYFTTGNFPYPLRITPPNHEVVEEACRYCHQAMVAAVDHPGLAPITSRPAGDTIVRPGEASLEPLSCTRCHRYVGHWVR